MSAKAGHEEWHLKFKHTGAIYTAARAGPTPGFGWGWAHAAALKFAIWTRPESGSLMSPSLPARHLSAMIVTNIMLSESLNFQNNVSRHTLRNAGHSQL